MAGLALEIPVIETERLILRGARIDDFAAIHAMWNEPAVMKYVDGKPRPREVGWTKFLRNAGYWVHLGFGYWIVEEKASGVILGETGFGDFKRDMEPGFGDELEAGWAFASAAHGKGYAYEAVSAALDWGDMNFAGRNQVCIIAPENVPSLRLAAKVGFVETGRAHYHGKEVVMHRRDKASL